MADSVISMPMSKAGKGLIVTVKLHGLYRFKVRLWLMAALLKLVGWVSPVTVEIEIEDPSAWLSQNGKPPRRSDVGHPSFSYEIGRRLLIRLDGVEQDKVVSYDTDAGEIVRWNGPSKEMMSGRVTVEWKDE